MGFSMADNGLHILLIEDDLNLLRLYSKILRNAGHEVKMAATVSAAGMLVRDYHFDIWVVDVSVGKLNMLHTMVSTSDFRRANAHRIIISGDVKQRDRATAMGLTFLLKPISHQQLLDAIQALVPVSCAG